MYILFMMLYSRSNGWLIILWNRPVYVSSRALENPTLKSYGFEYVLGSHIRLAIAGWVLINLNLSNFYYGRSRITDIPVKGSITVIETPKAIYTTQRIDRTIKQRKGVLWTTESMVGHSLVITQALQPTMTPPDGYKPIRFIRGATPLESVELWERIMSHISVLTTSLKDINESLDKTATTFDA